MRLHSLSPKHGSRHRTKRLGCGESSGHGKTSGKGHKGQHARSGGSIRHGFEGGQMPLLRRIPKRGFNNSAFKTHYAPVNTGDLNTYPDGAEVNEESLRQTGLVNGRWDGVKILARGELTKKLNLTVHAISAAAREKVQKAGGTVNLITKKNPKHKINKRK